MKKYFKKFIVLFILLIPALVLADTSDSNTNKAIKNLDDIGSKQGPYELAGDFTLSQIIGTVISVALALIGAIFLALMLYAGYHWMTARGEEEKVEQAKDTINRAVVGLIIVVGAYAIWQFIFNELILK